jgi:hypothetical protein
VPSGSSTETNSSLTSDQTQRTQVKMQQAGELSNTQQLRYKESGANWEQDEHVF